MALQFIFGPAGAGKTHRLIKDMIDKSMEMEDKRFVAVVPEQYSMETQKEILDMQQFVQKILMNIYIQDQILVN